MPLRNIDFEGIDEKRLWREIERALLDEVRQKLRDGWLIDEKTGLLQSPDGQLTFPERKVYEQISLVQLDVPSGLIVVIKLNEFVAYMDEVDDPDASSDLLKAVQKDSNGKQFVLDCLKEGKYLRSCIWLAQAMQIKEAIPLIEGIEDERFQEHKKNALKALNP